MIPRNLFALIEFCVFSKTAIILYAQILRSVVVNAVAAAALAGRPPPILLQSVESFVVFDPTASAAAAGWLGRQCLKVL